MTRFPLISCVFVHRTLSSAWRESPPKSVWIFRDGLVRKRLNYCSWWLNLMEFATRLNPALGRFFLLYFFMLENCFFPILIRCSKKVQSSKLGKKDINWSFFLSLSCLELSSVILTFTYLKMSCFVLLLFSDWQKTIEKNVIGQGATPRLTSPEL